LGSSSAYHHAEMIRTAHPLSDRAGSLFPHSDYPLSPGSPPRLKRRPLPLGILGCLDDVLYAVLAAREALRAAQMLIDAHHWFGCLIHSAKRAGTEVGIQVLEALCVRLDLAIQTLSVPPDTVRRTLDAARALASGPSLVPRAQRGETRQ